MSLIQQGLRHARRLYDRDGGLKARFLLVGGVNSAFGLGIFPLLVWLLAPLHPPYLLIMVISYPLAITFSFITNKLITFRTKRNYLAEFSRFGLFQLICFLTNLVALPLMVEVIGMRPVPAQVLFALCVMVSSYFWHSRITFRHRPSVE